MIIRLKRMTLIALAALAPSAVMASEPHCDVPTRVSKDGAEHCPVQIETQPSAFVQRAFQTRVGTARTLRGSRHLEHLCQEADGPREAVARHLALALREQTQVNARLDHRVERKVWLKKHCSV